MRSIAVAALLTGSMLAGFVISRGLEREPTAAEALTTAANSSIRQNAAAGGTAADFELHDLDGVPRRFSEWAGRVRIVNFWATWCVPCRREIPLLKELQAKAPDEGLQVIGVAIDDLADVAAFAEDIQFNYPILHGDEDAIAAAEVFGIEFMAMPLTLIVAPDGELLNAHVGEFKREDADHALPILSQLVRGEISNSAAREALAGI